MIRGLLFALGLSLAAAGAPAFAAELDITSEPPGILSAKNQQRLWDAYKTAKACFEHPTYGPGVPLKVATIKATDFAATPWVSPFTAVTGAAACAGGAGGLLPPKPIPVVKLDEAYGERQGDVNAAAVWFRRLATYHRYTGDPVARDLLKQALVAWAKAKGLGKGIHVSWGAKPVDYQMMATIGSILAATAEIAPYLGEDERAVIGPWLNDLVKQAAASHWKDREDNKVFMRTYIAMIWGLMVGDDRPVQEAINTVKLAVHDMRPDGSWPIDSQRGGMGINYNSAATSHLVMIATALRERRGIDLFDYSVDGRSLHNAVDFVVRSIEDPSLNKLYAIPCPDGGDRWGTIDAPNMHFAEGEAGYLLAYADSFPDRPQSKAIVRLIKLDPGEDSEKSGGIPACLFARTGGQVALAPLVMPPPPPTLPKPKFAVLTHEEDAHRVGASSEVNSLLISAIKGGRNNEDELNFNVVGRFAYPTRTFTELHFVLNANLGKIKPKELAACGAQTTTYEDGEHHVIIQLIPDGDRFVAKNGECIVAALPKNAAFQAKFLLNSFRDVAIGMVSSGEAGSIKSDGLRIFIDRVALGEITVGM